MYYDDHNGIFDDMHCVDPGNLLNIKNTRFSGTYV